MGEMRSAYKILVGKSKGKRPLWRLILKRVLNKQGVKMCTGFIYIKTGLSDGLLEIR
jgi:hypothetical protein